MNPLTQSKNTIILPVLIALMLACLLSPAPKAFGVLPAPDGGYPGQNTAEGDDALFSLNAPASGIIWSFIGSLSTRRYFHTASLLPNGMVLVAGGVRSPAFWRVRNCTTRPAGPGVSLAGLTLHALRTRRPCCKTAWSLLQGDLTTISTVWRARNCTTRRALPGLPRAALPAHAIFTRRPCYKTARSLLQGDLVAAATF